MASVSLGMSLWVPRAAAAKPSDAAPARFQAATARFQAATAAFQWPDHRRRRFSGIRVGAAPPDGISEKVAESIKHAEEACSGDPVSGECAAAWDEVEELSAAASHARDRLKESDPLEAYCQDNPGTDDPECRTYED